MQINHLQKKSCKQFLVKNEIGAISENFSFDLFFNFDIFNVFLVKALSIISANQIEICIYI